MSTIPLTSPYSLKTATLTIAGDDFTAAVTQVEFQPSTSSSTVRTIGGDVYKDSAISEWSCAVGIVQDLHPSGLLRYLLDHEGEEKAVVFTPKVGGPGIAATLVMSPGAIGGTAGPDRTTASVNLAVVGKPVFVDAVAAPVVTSATPGGAAVGALVTIHGTGFTGATSVAFGAVSATVFTVLDDFTIVVSVPAGSAGSAPVTVVTPAGTSNALPYTRA